MIGLGAVIPGSIALFSALTGTGKLMREQKSLDNIPERAGLDEYSKGIQYTLHEIEIASNSNALPQMTFHSAVCKIYQKSKGEVILIGVTRKSKLRENLEVLINPSGLDEKLITCHSLFVIAKSYRGARDLLASKIAFPVNSYEIGGGGGGYRNENGEEAASNRNGGSDDINNISADNNGSSISLSFSSSELLTNDMDGEPLGKLRHFLNIY